MVEIDPASLSKLEPIMGGEIVCWRVAEKPEPDMIEAMGRALGEAAKHPDFLLVILVGNDTIERVSEADMASAGWMRAGAESLFTVDL